MCFYFIKRVDLLKMNIKLLVSIMQGVRDQKIFHLLSLKAILRYFPKISITMHLKHNYFIFMLFMSFTKKQNLETYFQFRTELAHKVFLNIRFQKVGKKQLNYVYRNDLLFFHIELIFDLYLNLYP